MRNTTAAGCWPGRRRRGFGLVDEYLAYLVDRNYSPKTVHTYGYDLLASCRWLATEGVSLSGVTTEVLLRFLRACREAKVPARPGPNVVRLSGRRMDQYAATTINADWPGSRACSPSPRCATRT